MPSEAPSIEKGSVQERMQTEFKAVGIRFEKPRSFNIPEPDFKHFGAREREIQSHYDRLVRWLTMPYIHDRFGGDHQARRAWRKQFFTMYGALGIQEWQTLQQNKFRANMIGVLGLLLGQLRRSLDAERKCDDIIQAIDAIRYDPMLKSQKFTNMESAERKKIIESVESQVVLILQLLASKAPAEKEVA